MSGFQNLKKKRKKEIAGVKQGSLSVGDYNSKFRALWKELELYMNSKLCCAQKVELLGGVNLEFQAIRAQVTSQDPLPPRHCVCLL